VQALDVPPNDGCLSTRPVQGNTGR